MERKKERKKPNIYFFAKFEFYDFIQEFVYYLMTLINYIINYAKISKYQQWSKLGLVQRETDDREHDMK